MHIFYSCFVCFLFVCSLKQAGIHTGNPWPPYKERTPLHPCYRGLVRLLHCKTLHIVIFTLLYKVLNIMLPSFHPNDLTKLILILSFKGNCVFSPLFFCKDTFFGEKLLCLYIQVQFKCVFTEY